MRKKLVAAACVLATLVSTALPSKLATAAPNTLQIKEIAINGTRPHNRRNIWLNAKLVVPENDVNSTPAYGEYSKQLSLYDAHMAKMFELTDQLCLVTNARYYGINGFTWDYQRSIGRIRVGQYRIGCSLASDVSKAYGGGKQLQYKIRDLGQQGSVTEYSVPVLNITGSKVGKWENFMQGIRSHIKYE